MYQGLTPEGKGYRSARDGFNLEAYNMFWENDLDDSIVGIS